jgi:hypothetical protein
MTESTGSRMDLIDRDKDINYLSTQEVADVKNLLQLLCIVRLLTEH